jgi:hypothetical protein
LRWVDSAHTQTQGFGKLVLWKCNFMHIRLPNHAAQHHYYFHIKCLYKVCSYTKYNEQEYKIKDHLDVMTNSLKKATQQCENRVRLINPTGDVFCYLRHASNFPSTTAKNPCMSFGCCYQHFMILFFISTTNNNMINCRLIRSRKPVRKWTKYLSLFSSLINE